jgi:hypothetical protein
VGRLTRLFAWRPPPLFNPQAFLNKTIRENKSAAIMNMGKGVYGLKEWGRSGQSKEQQASPDALPGGSSSSKASAAGVAHCPAALSATLHI